MSRICNTSAGRRHDGGFTLIELLVVIAIMATLSALVLVGATQLGIGSKKRKTETILAILRQGIELGAASKGSTVSSVEHPLAGSRPGRLLFAGQRGRAADGSGGSWVAALDASGEGLVGAPEWFVQGSDRNRVLMPDDTFADTRVPMLFGARRELLGIIGAEMGAVTRYRRLSPPKPPELLLPAPYDGTNARYSDALCLVKPAGVALDNKRALDYLFGGSSVISELSGLKAVYTPPDDDATKRLYPPTTIASTDNGGRVWSPDGGDPADGKSFWEAGRIQEGLMNSGPDAGQPDWKLYKLRGLGIYDAWNREILFSYSSSGAVRLLSAGYDGVLRWNPGQNRVLDTAANATAAGGDDKDGERDNIRQEVAQ
ncbi:MAG: prepilin-type N-terminal cleavage/methylation domain-containing protein [Planctomycetes bacterium]|nr:prepilin-type N-terminal cleavage/methylation domain-containing protein [Planctomycetota bacterium]